MKHPRAGHKTHLEAHGIKIFVFLLLPFLLLSVTVIYSSMLRSIIGNGGIILESRVCNWGRGVKRFDKMMR